MSRPRPVARTTALVLATGLSAAALSGCEFRGAASLPLPGGQGNGSDAYQLTVEFTDVLDLVPQSAVKVDDVTVGSVKSIEATDFTARVVVSINGDVALPANSRASLRQTSLLGEKFVSFDPPPASEAQGRLRGGETIGLDRTTRSAEIEEVLSALSLVLNGGSLEQLQVINDELNAALAGREDRVKDLLDQLNVFVGGLDAQKAQIVRALDSLDTLSARLVTERETIATALEDIPAGVEVLTEQRKDLTRVLTSLDDLGDVAVRVIRASQTNTVADLRALDPILTNLSAAGKALPESLELLTTYPFPRTVSEGIKGDYANLFITLDGNVSQLLTGTAGLPIPGGVLPGSTPAPSAAAPLPGVPSVPLPGVQAPAQAPAGTAPSASPSPSPTPGSLLPGLPGAKLPVFGPDTGGLLRLLLGGLS